MPYAVLRVKTEIVALADDWSQWSSTVECAKPPGFMGSSLGVEPNPRGPAREALRNTYTHSELPENLEACVVERIKDVARASATNEDGWARITSLRQMWIGRRYPKYARGPLDQIYIDTPTMLNWIEGFGWSVVSITTDHHFSDYLLYQMHVDV